MNVPENRKAEQCVIGCCLLGGSKTASLATSQLSETDFGDAAFASAFTVIRGLVEDGSGVDLAGVHMRWCKVVETPRQPPIDVLQSQDAIGHQDQLPQFIAAVRETSRRRKLWLAGHALVVGAADAKRDVGEVEAAAISAIEGDGQSKHVDALDGNAAMERLITDTERRMLLAGKLSGIGTGFTMLDAKTDGLQPQELSIFAARPSQGKSALLCQIAAHAALQSNVPTLVISLEMSLEAIMRRMCAAVSEVPLAKLRTGQLTEGEHGRLANFNSSVRKKPIWFADFTSGANVNRITGLVRYHANRHGLKLVVCDYLQKIRPAGRHEKRTYELAEVSGALKALAVRHGLHVCCAAQLSREPDKGDSRPPRLSDLADSGQIERDADLVCMIYRPKTDEDPTGLRTKLIIGKQRDGETGVVGFDFNPALCRFEQ